MQITLDPDTERFVEQCAQKEGFDNASDFIAELIGREWRRRMAELHGITKADIAAYREEMERYAADADQAAEDVAMAEEWLPLEEEAHEILERGDDEEKVS